ncbi:MAG: hypothetical protein ABSA93_09055 [Streptosporangiaceae bacterium]|jgi:hypothetical protein
MADDEVGVEPGRLAELATALENLRDVLAGNAPVIVSTLEEYWNSGTGTPVNLSPLKQAQAQSVKDAADMRARSDLAQAWVDHADVCLTTVTIPWDSSKQQLDAASAAADAKILAAAEGKNDLQARAQILAVQADIQDHLDEKDMTWLGAFYGEASPQVANLASVLNKEDGTDTVLLSSADEKILNTYASGLALLSRTGNLTQPVIDKYTGAPDLWSVAMLVKCGPGGSAYGTSTSWARGSKSQIQQGFLAQVTDAVYTATGNGTITLPVDWIKAGSSASALRAMPQTMSQYDPLTAMLQTDAQNKTAVGQVLAGTDGVAIAKTLEQTPFLSYMQSYRDPAQLVSAGWSERTGEGFRTQLYNQQVIASFLTAATDDPANVNDSPPRGNSPLAWQAAQAAIRIVDNAPDPSQVVVSEPVRQAMLTTFGRYLPDMAISDGFDATEAAKAPQLVQGTYQLWLDGKDADGPMVAFEQQIEYDSKDAGTLQGIVVSALGTQFGLQASGKDPNTAFSSDLADDLATLYGQTITQQQNLHYSPQQAKDAADTEINTIIAVGEAAAGTISIGGTAVTAAKDALSISVPLIPQFSTDNASNQAAADLNAYAQDESVLDIPMVQGLIKAGVVVPPDGANWYANGRIDPTGDYVHWWDEHKGLFIYDLPTTNDPQEEKLAANPTNSYTMEGWRNTLGVVNMDLIRQMQTEEGN